jgi:hypothetical protein
MDNDSFLIETNELTKRYDGEIVAVDHLRMRLRRGEVYGFLGPNGGACPDRRPDRDAELLPLPLRVRQPPCPSPARVCPVNAG